MKILLADDHELVRDGTRITLQRFNKDVTIIEAADFDEVLQILHNAPELDLILLDLSMPGMNGFDAIHEIKSLCPSVPIIVVSASEQPETIQHALQNGIQGYIPKTSSRDIIINAIQLVLSGSVYVPPALLKGLSVSDQPSSHPHIPDSEKTVEFNKRLTQRQRDVLNLLKQGKTNRQIGETLGMSEATVRTHLTAAYKVLKVSNRTQAVHILNQLTLS